MHQLKTIHVLLLLCAMLVIPPVSFATTYYVDNDGDGSSPTETCAACPCPHASTTIANIVSSYNLTPSTEKTTVWICGGTYSEQVTVTTADDGTSSYQVEFKGMPGQTAIIDGGGVRAYGVNATNSSYLTLDNLTFTGATTTNLWSDNAGTGYQISNISCTSGNDCLWIRSKSASSYHNISASGITRYGFVLSNTASDVTVGEISVTGGAGANTFGPVSLSSITNLTIDGDITGIGGGTTGLNPGMTMRYLDGNLVISGDITIQDAAYKGLWMKTNTSSVLVSGAGVITTTGGANAGVTFDEFTFGSGSAFARIISSGNTGDGIYIVDTNGEIVVESFSLHDNNQSGITIHGTNSGMLFTSNIHDYGPSEIYNNSNDGFAVYGSVSATIENTIIYDNGGGGVPISEGDGITGHSTSTVYAYNNIIYSNDNTCFAFVSSANLYAYNNTCADNGVVGGPRGQILLGNNSGVVTLKNNIFSGGLPYEVFVADNANIGVIVSDYNLYDPAATATAFSTSDGGTTKQADLSAWQAVSGEDANSRQATAGFMGTSDYRLSAGSPARRRGVAGLITTDSRGRAVIGAPDLGAYQGSESITRAGRRPQTIYAP